MTAVDLRSDTVTRPSPAMRQAIAAAEVGDDVLGEDPTVAALEVRAAALMGKEAALFVPSGSMANQIALKIHCQPGDDVIIGEGAHNFLYEAGAGGAIAGVQFTVAGTGGLFSGDDVHAAFKRSPLHHVPPTSLVCVENTHNRGGGRVWPLSLLHDVARAARDLGIALHLDGARVLNAAVALGVPAAVLAAPFDTASLCFSKGLGAPVGSIIAGSRASMVRAHRFRKMLGGGMRQAGILAAAALFALEHNVARLADDHARAGRLAAALGQVPGLVVEPARVETNIVMLDLAPRLPEAAEFAEAARVEGVLVLPFGPRRLRLVTHLDVSDEDVGRAASVLAELARRHGG